MIHWLDAIITEYKQGLFTSKLSREDLFQITKIVPAYKNWGNEEFALAKKQIIKNYSLSNNDFSRALNAINNHREFSYLINNKKQTIEITEETILNFFRYWIKINPQPKISKEEQEKINKQKNENILNDFDSQQESYETFIKRITYEGEIFKEYWRLHGCNLTNLDVAYLTTFYSNIDFDYSERFFRTFNHELEVATKIPEENKININSLFNKFRYLEKTIKNLLLLKEIEIAKNLISHLEIPFDNYPIAFYESGHNMPSIEEYYRKKFN